MKPLIQGHSGTAPETSRDEFGTNQGTNEDDYHSDSHPEAGIFNNQTRQNSGPEGCHDMVTEVYEEVNYISQSSSSGKQKNRSALPDNRTSAMITLLRQSKQNRFFWPISGWQTTTILQIFLTKLMEIPSFQSHSPQ